VDLKCGTMDKVLEAINKKTEEIFERLVKFRREIHRNPELGGSEEKTSSPAYSRTTTCKSKGTWPGTGYWRS
jgi:hypothetical protein